MLTPLTALHRSRWRALASRATEPPRTWPPRGDHAGWHGPARPLCHWARPTVRGLRLESQPSTVWRFSDFQFLFIILENLYKVQKCVENTLLLRKI
jgi:hypothetical protein